MGELINGRTPEHIKAGLRCRVTGDAKCSDCAYYGTVLYEIGQREYECDDIDRDALALIARLESERDAAIRDLKLISHCYTCSNQDLDKRGVCKNSGGGGAPFMKCPGYLWDKKLPEPPKEGE